MLNVYTKHVFPNNAYASQNPHILLAQPSAQTLMQKMQSLKVPAQPSARTLIQKF